MPDIAINRALMDTLSEAQKEEWVESSPTRVFRYNTITKQACWLCGGSPRVSPLAHRRSTPRPQLQWIWLWCQCEGATKTFLVAMGRFGHVMHQVGVPQARWGVLLMIWRSVR